MRSIGVATLFALVVMASSQNTNTKVHYDVENPQPIFEDFIKQHNRQYKDEADKQLHFIAFVENLKKINRLNSLDSGANYGINKFADYTEEESKSMRGFGRSN